MATALLVAVSAVRLSAQATLAAGALTLSLDESGQVTALRSSATRRDYLSHEAPAPLLTVVHGAERLAPTALAVKRVGAEQELTLLYGTSGVKLVVRARPAASHLRLEIVSAQPAELVDAVVWGPYPTTIARTVGEIIGVVRDDTVALGLQVLNAKTLGGDLPNDEGSTWARGIAATAKPWGSTIQAYAINRDRERRVAAWGGVYKDMPVAPIKGETVVGSAIALFTCPDRETIDRLERIEVAEHLPHPLIGGVWYRKSPVFERSYMISSFGESEVDEMVGYAKRSGLYSLYHEGPFKSWGHFVLDDRQWPGGRAAMKSAVEKARAAGLHFGVHTLTNFINTNDPYVTPVPDARLSVTGAAPLVRAVDATATSIEVESPAYFAPEKDNNLHAVRIGTEIVQYRAVSTSAPWMLLDCQRGAFGTKAAAHPAGAPVGKLFDHAYKVFFPDFAMQREVAANLADFLNETGVDHLDFDGHEGALASGQGDFALAVFAEDVMRRTKHDLIMGTSISKTFYWHIGTYYNWGEPWYGGFRESMQQYRIDNQALFDRNLMPHMLGWYLLTETTTLPEMEWMLARAAGYGAGFAMVARPKALRNNPLTPALLDAIREWEDARTRHAFTPAQQARLKDPRNEFHLERTGDAEWRLQEFVLSEPFVRERVERQPGEPTTTTWEFKQSWETQPLQLRITATGKSGTARALRFTIDKVSSLRIPVELGAGESLIVDGTTTAIHYDAQGRPKGRITLDAPPPIVGAGAHRVEVDSEFSGDEPLRIEVRFRGAGRTERVAAPR